AASSAAEAAAQGKQEQAKEIMVLWATDAVGSEIGSLVGAAIAGIGVGALAAAGAALSAPLAGALVVGAALAGGFYGAEGGKELYSLLKDRDANGRRDIID